MLETKLTSTCLRSATSSMKPETESSRMELLFMLSSSLCTSSLAGDHDDDNGNDNEDDDGNATVDDPLQETWQLGV